MHHSLQGCLADVHGADLDICWCVRDCSEGGLSNSASKEGVQLGELVLPYSKVDDRSSGGVGLRWCLHHGFHDVGKFLHYVVWGC